MKYLLLLTILFTGTYTAQDSVFNEKADYLEVAELLLENIKEQKATDTQVDLIARSTLEELEKLLDTDDKKLAFWINIYNSFIQLQLAENPELYEDRKSFFKTPSIDIAGEKLSFEQIEHGIIRKSQNPVGLGYLRKLCPPKYERKLRVSERDYRVHFVLNCGAKSCPPVTVLRYEHLDKQLDFMAKKFLSKFTTYNESNDQYLTTPLFSWFRGDFGGRKGTKKILKKYEIVDESKFSVKCDEYDWTLFLNNFIDTPFNE